MKTIFVIGSLLLPVAVDAAIAVVVHPSNQTSLTQEDLARLYTGKLSAFTDGSSAVPVNLADSAPLRSEFDQKALGRSSSQVKAFWSKLVFTGKGTPPKEVASDAEVLTLVANNPNIIGYVSAGAVSDQVKVLLTLE
ncbi:phosphate ABC transporter substrate-binding protein [Rheinheimera muenzenbergensis]|uniref:Phosphate ABC transporter substrate-binding protein n=1 Tax=Rheinheimera muenzenbergensis TaxID=1193628 RepID=A0ABU8C3V6_9GAMM|nr:phosphate ABC transporter substrate-binding protein [Gammaproteobacteria bacterium]MBU1555568.1 phosphate ABC transporter substrate-binding protein [Gammaproteobacteria bacterium]MBU2071167.1 phosphate ABC transporter substrate-binding protein [Gammaproteobacteria bacterium]MBU2184383.1 phosphate ABC transporter substrate-binding protein [Gammaproteobacteria bacterium]MBU2206235.1 phosphate ABC transporter substrate-binding protein [Gammaproteobacteria bacterium]